MSTKCTVEMLQMHPTHKCPKKIYYYCITLPTVMTINNKPRTAKVGAISKAQSLKGGPFGLCETPAGCKNFEKKLKGGPFGDMKKFPKKNF